MDTEDIKNGACGLIGVALSSTGIALGDIEAIVSIVCSIAGLMITICFTVLIPVIKKFIAAKKNDGKIDLNEAEDIVNTLSDGLEKAKDEIDKINKDK